MYKFFIREFFEETEVFPIISGNFGVKYADVDNEAFKRPEVQGVLIFKGPGYQFILDRDINTRLYLRVEGKTEFECFFTRRMGVMDYDNRVFRVTPIMADGYYEFENAIDRPYNWLAHGPQVTPAEIPVMGVIQIYRPGSTRITCWGKGGYWTQPVENVVTTQGRLRSEHGFGQTISVMHLQTKDQLYHGGGLSSYILDLDNAVVQHGWGIVEIETTDGHWKLELETNPGITTDPARPGYPEVPFERWVMRNMNDGGAIVYAEYSGHWTYDYRHPHDRQHIDNTWLVHVGTGSHMMVRAHTFMMRLVTKRGFTEAWQQIPDNDIMPASMYRFALPLQGTIFLYDAWADVENPYYGTQPEHAFYNRTPDNHPFPNEQMLVPTGNHVPIDPEAWEGFSVWFTPSGAQSTYVNGIGYSETHILRHCYPIEGVIQALLQGAGVDIQFELSDSEFFQANPLYVTPKGNLVRWDYSTPATVNEMSLRGVLDMLKKYFRLFWHIDDGHLKIEHISWYMRGGTYSGEPDIALDMTTTQDLRGLRYLADGLSSVRFDDLDVPFGVDHKYMDPASHIFQGFHIRYNIVVYPGINTAIENVEHEPSADLQFMLINPGRHSTEGLFLLHATGTPLEVPFDTFALTDPYGPGPSYTLLNGKVSLLYVLDRFHGDDLLTDRHYINTIFRTDSELVKLSMLQDVNFPIGYEIDWLKAYRTWVGLGLMKEFVLNLDTGYVTGTLMLAERRNLPDPGPDPPPPPSNKVKLEITVRHPNGDLYTEIPAEVELYIAGGPRVAFGGTNADGKWTTYIDKDKTDWKYDVVDALFGYPPMSDVIPRINTVTDVYLDLTFSPP